MRSAAPERPLYVVGVAGQRRVRLLTEAATRVGLEVEVLDWAVLLDHLEADTWPDWPTGSVVRIDSTGEDQTVEHRLRALGGFDHRLAFGEVGGWAAWARGLGTAVEHLSRGGWRLDTSIDDVTALFDKRITRTRLTAESVPVPAPGPPVDDLLTTPGRWFLKPTHGSSATGVMAIVVGPARPSGTRRLDAWAPLELVDGVPFTSLRVHRFTGRRVTEVVTALASRGPMLTERWFPKTTVAGRAVDLRVLVVDGTARTVVVRGSRSPMTNLHLGNARVPIEDARAGAGSRWPGLLELAERAAGCFPDTPSVGVDVLPGSGWRRAVVGEVNAFGDLLPGALQDGRDSYDWQVAGYASRLRDGMNA